jgi:uncharacterized OB-fold protein
MGAMMLEQPSLTGCQRLPERRFPGADDPSLLRPPRSADTDPHRGGLRERRLMLQRCARCDRLRFPPGPVCPACGFDKHRWERHGGAATVHSWIRYHRAYLPEYEPLMPYVVVCAQLQDGPRMFGRLCDAGVEPAFGMRLQAIVERCPSDECILGFAAAGVEESGGS